MSTTPLLIQSAATTVVAYLEATDGTPATGVAYTSVTGGIKKTGASAFTSFPLTAGNWLELGNGFYQVSLTASNTDTLGSLYLSFVTSTTKPSLLVGYVTTATTASPAPPPPFTPTTTNIYGYVFDMQGAPVEGTVVSARLVTAPTVIHPTTDGIGIDNGFVTTTTDSTGRFSLDLLTGATIEFLIPDLSYRRTVTIPGTNSNLFDIP